MHFHHFCLDLHYFLDFFSNLGICSYEVPSQNHFHCIIGVSIFVCIFHSIPGLFKLRCLLMSLVTLSSINSVLFDFHDFMPFILLWLLLPLWSDGIQEIPSISLFVKACFVFCPVVYFRGTLVRRWEECIFYSVWVEYSRDVCCSHFTYKVTWFWFLLLLILFLFLCMTCLPVRVRYWSHPLVS